MLKHSYTGQHSVQYIRRVLYETGKVKKQNNNWALFL